MNSATGPCYPLQRPPLRRVRTFYVLAALAGAIIVSGVTAEVLLSAHNQVDFTPRTFQLTLLHGTVNCDPTINGIHFPTSDIYFVYNGTSDLHGVGGSSILAGPSAARSYIITLYPGLRYSVTIGGFIAKPSTIVPVGADEEQDFTC